MSGYLGALIAALLLVEASAACRTLLKEHQKALSLCGLGLAPAWRCKAEICAPQATSQKICQNQAFVRIAGQWRDLCTLEGSDLGRQRRFLRLSLRCTLSMGGFDLKNLSFRIEHKS